MVQGGGRTEEEGKRLQGKWNVKLCVNYVSFEKPLSCLTTPQCRGWGADTAPPHINELYQKQMDLYEQSKRREALSALSLAIASPR